MTIPEPYVSEGGDEEEASKKSKKKKKKKSSTSSDPYVDSSGSGGLASSGDPYVDTGDNIEMTSSSHHSEKPKKEKKPKSERKPKSEKIKKPKSERKPKSEKTKKPKSERKKKSKSKEDSYDPYESFAYAETVQEEEEEYPVLEASGWEPLLAKDLNLEHAHASGLHYAITGAESQIVTVALPPGAHCQGEPGSMMYLTDSVHMKVSCGLDWFGRCCGGESCCVVNFTNHHAANTGYAALVTNDPLAKVVPVDMNHPAVGGSLVVQSGAYVASYGEVHLGYDCDCNLVRCCCGGMGLVRQKIEGSGTAFLGATGTIVQKVLAEGEVLLVDTNCLLAYSSSCRFEVKKTGGIVNWIGGGEGFFNSSITGPGLAIVQSMNLVVLLESLAADKMYRR